MKAISHSPHLPKKPYSIMKPLHSTDWSDSVGSPWNSISIILRQPSLWEDWLDGTLGAGVYVIERVLWMELLRGRRLSPDLIRFYSPVSCLCVQLGNELHAQCQP